MSTFLLVMIYLAFISLGLPDSLLGVSWPVMQSDFKAPLETAGFLFMTIAGGTIISSLVSGKILNRFGTGHSQTIMGYQMAVAYTGSTFIPPLLGFVASHTSIGIIPFCVVLFVVAMFISSEKLNGLLKKKELVKRSKSDVSGPSIKTGNAKILPYASAKK